MSAAPAPPASAPSVFLSYASADRAAARALRDALVAAGLDVWLDEEELAGGEAWDAKIRNQIRSCTYFMPLISATTEQRREGYFRREWRLAVERTLDQADDVLFLVPVVIDDTRDTGARVPEKFLTVQWLRVPGGVPTPELLQLAARLAAGDSHALPPTTGASPTPRAGGRERKAGAPPPPFPHFPPYPEKGQLTRFLYHIVIWAGHMIHALWMRLPRVVRLIASIVIVFNVIAWIFRSANSPGERSDREADVAREVADAVRGAGAPKANSGADAIQSLLGAAAHALQNGRPLALVTFDGQGEPASRYAGEVFAEAFRSLQAPGGNQVGLSPIPLGDGDDDDALARGTALDSQFVLTGRVDAAAPNAPLVFTARLYSVKQRKIIWTETYDTTQVAAPEAARRVVAAVQPHLSPAPSP